MKFDKVLWYSPSVLRNIFVSLWSYRKDKTRRKGASDRYFEEYKQLWNSSEVELEEYQNRKLKELLGMCLSGSPYYRDIMVSLGVGQVEIDNDPRSVLAILPKLSKSDRKSKFESIVNDDLDLVNVGFTSGTSGSPMITHYDSESFERSFALWDRFHWGIGLEDVKSIRKVRLSGKLFINPIKKTPPFWVSSYFDKSTYMSTYHMTENNLYHYIKKLNDLKPELIDGYPSALNILANFVQNRSDAALNFSPKYICTTAETLTESMRSNIENAFGCKVFNQYSSSEGGGVITECKLGKLHANADSAVFEYERIGNSDFYNLIVTSFRNNKTPLIRYEQGDVVSFTPSSTCSCGSVMQVIDSVVGRMEDVLYTKEKGYIGRMDPAFKGVCNVRSAQIVQNEIDHITIKLIPEDGFNDTDGKLLLGNISARVGEGVVLKLEIVDSIPVGANGKIKAVLREFSL